MSSVELMRLIVWWVPQFGHWETSSNRRRQYTHRKRPGSWVGRSHGSPHPGHAGRLISVFSVPAAITLERGAAGR